jgi:hypothetical protein
VNSIHDIYFKIISFQLFSFPDLIKHHILTTATITKSDTNHSIISPSRPHFHSEFLDHAIKMSSQSTTSFTSGFLVLCTYITTAVMNLAYSIEQPQAVLATTSTSPIFLQPTPTTTYGGTTSPTYHQLFALFYFLLLGALVGETNSHVRYAWWLICVVKKIVWEKKGSEEMKFLKDLVLE